MINAWAARTGLASHETRTPREVLAQIAACDTLQDKLAYVGDANDTDAPVLWLSPGIAFDSAGNVICPAP